MVQINDMVSIQFNMTKDVKAKRVAIPKLMVNITLVYHYEAGALSAEKVNALLRKELIEGLQAERSRLARYVAKADKEMHTLLRQPGAHEAAEAILVTLNTARLGTLKTHIVKLLSLNLQRVASKKGLEEFTSKLKVVAPKHLFELAPGYVDYLRESGIGADDAPKKRKVGPLKFNLLAGMPNLEPLVVDPPKLILTVRVECEVKSDGGIQLEFLSEPAAKAAKRCRKVLAKHLPAWRDELQTLLEQGDVEGAQSAKETMVGAMKRFIADARADAEQAVKKAAADFANRRTDVKFFRADTGTEVVFAGLNVLTSAKELFTNPPGWNLIAPIVVAGRNGKRFLDSFRSMVGKADRLHRRLEQLIAKLESDRQLQIVRAEAAEGEGPQSTSLERVWAKVKEVLIDDITAAERYISALQVETTKIQKVSQNMGRMTARLVELQEKLPGDTGDQVAPAIQTLIECTQKISTQVAFFEQDAEKFEAAIESIKDDVKMAVKLGKLSFDVVAFFSILGAAEAGIHGIIKLKEYQSKQK